MTTTDDAPNMAAAALALAARGLPVFPLWPPNEGGVCACGDAGCPSPAKHPLGLLVPRGFLDATTDAGTIREWWALWPDANIGMRTGAASGVVALDLDARGGGWDSADRLQADHGPIPRTRATLTGGGGAHIWFTAPPGVHIPTRAGKLAPGLDLRGDGGFVVVPPSLHASGRRYTFGIIAGDGDDPDAPPPDPWTVPPAPLPPWLLALIGAGSPTRPPTALVLGADELLTEGGRNDMLTSLAGTMRRRGFLAPSILAALRSESVLRCRPPLDDDELVKIATSVARYAPAAGTAAPATIRGRRPPLGQAVRHGR